MNIRVRTAHTHTAHTLYAIRYPNSCIKKYINVLQQLALDGYERTHTEQNLILIRFEFEIKCWVCCLLLLISFRSSLAVIEHMRPSEKFWKKFLHSVWCHFRFVSFFSIHLNYSFMYGKCNLRGIFMDVFCCTIILHMGILGFHHICYKHLKIWRVFLSIIRHLKLCH